MLIVFKVLYFNYLFSRNAVVVNYNYGKTTTFSYNIVYCNMYTPNAVLRDKFKKKLYY